ncbi:MAG: FtsH protease activity modulator HflK [Phycisphaerae bacterium]|nr:FtsH protease activity modulator HflK [Phycisphaerae bacterium]
MNPILRQLGLDPDWRLRLFRWRVRAAVVAAIAVAVYPLTGFYVVDQDERGVVRRFGHAVARNVEPGIHYAPPWPISRVDRPRTSEVRRIGVGFRLADGEYAEEKAEVLTGDENILVVTIIVQYRIEDPTRYLFATENPDDLVHGTVCSLLIEHVGRLEVDNVLTIAKAPLQSAIRAAAQQQLDDYGAGVRLLSADFQIVDPPKDAIHAFKDVASAKKDNEKVIDEAGAYRQTILRKTQGLAFRAIEEAHAYATRMENEARGQSERFLSQLEEYRKAPEITRRRLLLDALQQCLRRVKKIVADHAPGEAPAHIRILRQE